MSIIRTIPLKITDLERFEKICLRAGFSVNREKGGFSIFKSQPSYVWLRLMDSELGYDEDHIECKKAASQLVQEYRLDEFADFISEDAGISIQSRTVEENGDLVVEFA